MGDDQLRGLLDELVVEASTTRGSVASGGADPGTALSFQNSTTLAVSSSDTNAPWTR